MESKFRLARLLGNAVEPLGCTIREARELANAFAPIASAWRGESKVTSIGFGLRGPAQRPCIIVQVDREASLKELGSIPPDFEGFPVWVEVNQAVPASLFFDRFRRAFGGRPKRSWPGWAGSAIRADRLRKSGTLGCFVTNGSEYFALTSRHVLTDGSHPPKPGESVWSFCHEDPERSVLLGKVRADRDPCQVEHDCSLIELDSDRSSINVVPQVGRLSQKVIPLDDVKLGTRVCKYGSVSKLTVGIVSAVQNLTSDDGSFPIAGPITGVAEITPEFDPVHKGASFCTRGDSGSVVVLRSHRATDVPAIGLLIARGTLLERGYMAGLDVVLKCLNVNLA